jgi:uncharacterized protein involved in exopolysaccharide biosynthesis
MNNSENKSERQQIQELLALCVKKWYVFAVTMVLCVAAAMVYMKVKTPVRSVLAKVNIRHNESLLGSAISQGQSMLSAFGFGVGSENVEDESNKLGSQGYIRDMIKDLGLNTEYRETRFLGLYKKKLYEKSPVVVAAAETMADTLLKPITFKVEVKENLTKIKMTVDKKTVGTYEITSFPSVLQTIYGEFTVSRSQYYDDYEKPVTLKILYSSYDYMAQIYSEIISVDFQKKTSDMIDLGVESENVHLAKAILNRLIDNYNERWDIEKQQVAQRTLAFIDERLQLVSDSLASADLDIQRFKTKYNLTDIEADVKYYFTLSGELQPAIIEAKAQSGMVDVAIDFVKDEKNRYLPLPLSLSPENTQIAEIIAKYNELLQKRNDFNKSGAQSGIAKSIDEQIEANRKALLQTLYNTKEGLKITVAELNRKEAEVNRKIGNIPDIEKDYVHLKRTQEIQQTIYIFLREMREESGARGISLLPKLQIIDPPYIVNKPVSPNRMKVLLAVLFFGGFVFPVGAIKGIPQIKLYLRKRKEK